MSLGITHFLHQSKARLVMLSTTLGLLLFPVAAALAQPRAYPPRPLPPRIPLEEDVGPEVFPEEEIESSFTGHVVSTEDRRMTIIRNDDEQFSLIIPEETEILLNGESVNLEELNPGDAVKVVTRTAEPRLARRVVAARVQFSPGVSRTEEAQRPERRTVRRPQTREDVQGADGTLGITVGPTPGDIAVVTEVAPGSPGDEAGLRVGDFIVTVNGQQLPNMMGAQNLDNLLGQRRPGTPVRLLVWQNGQRKQMRLSLSDEAARPSEPRRAGYRSPGEIRLRPGEQTETGRRWTARFETDDPSVQPRLQPGDQIFLEADPRTGEQRETRFPPEPPQGEAAGAQGEEATAPQEGETRRTGQQGEQQQRLESLVRDLSRSVQALQQDVRELKSRMETEEKAQPEESPGGEESSNEEERSGEEGLRSI